MVYIFARCPYCGEPAYALYFRRHSPPAYVVLRTVALCLRDGVVAVGQRRPRRIPAAVARKDVRGTAAKRMRLAPLG